MKAVHALTLVPVLVIAGLLAAALPAVADEPFVPIGTTSVTLQPVEVAPTPSFHFAFFTVVSSHPLLATAARWTPALIQTPVRRQTTAVRQWKWNDKGRVGEWGARGVTR